VNTFWHLDRCAFSAAVAGMLACGGSIASSRTVKGDGDAGFSDNPAIQDPCTGAMLCEENGDNGPEADAGVGGGGGGVLCGLNTGPLRPNQDAGGPVMRCDPGAMCASLAGQWACCAPLGTGGVSVCQPFVTDGGRVSL